MLVILIIFTTLSLKTNINKLLGMDKSNKFKIESGKTNLINFDELVSLKHEFRSSAIP